MNDIARLVDDLRATLDEFGAPGDGAGEMFSAPDPQVWRDLTQRRLRRTMPRWLMRLIAGGWAAATLTGGRGASSPRAKSELAWQPRYPTGGRPILSAALSH